MTKFSFLAAQTEESQEALDKLSREYGQALPKDADILVALGGDGHMLETMHKFHDLEKPIFGMNMGSVGFLLNPFREENLPERLDAAQSVTLYPLRMTAKCVNGENHEAYAYNEVSFLRETRQTAKLKISIDGIERLEELVCDGAIVSTPAGSTAYNYSAHGQIIPLDASLLALTPISAFRPRRWRGALLPFRSKIRFDVKEPKKRPVSAVADYFEARDIKYATVELAKRRGVTLLFDPDHHLEERILKEQFAP